MKKKIVRYIILSLGSIFASFIIFICIVFYIVHEEKNHAIDEIKHGEFSGYRITDISFTQEVGYDYYTSFGSIMFGKDYFENNMIQHLQVGDSIAKPRGSMSIEIYRKDESGKYGFLKLSE